MANKPQSYRHLIDDLVRMCHEGQGAIPGRRAREGVWNRNATAESMPDQHAANLLLARLSDTERDVVASLLSDAVSTGVFETLKALQAYGVPPFEDGYEETPFNDYVARLSSDWEWPDR